MASELVSGIPLTTKAPTSAQSAPQSIPQSAPQSTAQSAAHTPEPTPSTVNKAPTSSGNRSSPPTPTPSPEVTPPLMPQYFRHHNYADMELFLRKHMAEFPAIAHLSSVGKSVQGRELYVMVISDNPTVHEHGRSGTRDMRATGMFSFL